MSTESASSPNHEAKTALIRDIRINEWVGLNVLHNRIHNDIELQTVLSRAGELQANPNLELPKDSFPIDFVGRQIIDNNLTIPQKKEKAREVALKLAKKARLANQGENAEWHDGDPVPYDFDQLKNDADLAYLELKGYGDLREQKMSSDQVKREFDPATGGTALNHPELEAVLTILERSDESEAGRIRAGDKLDDIAEMLHLKRDDPDVVRINKYIEQKSRPAPGPTPDTNPEIVSQFAAALGIDEDDFRRRVLGGRPLTLPSRENARERTTFPGLQELFDRKDLYDWAGEFEPELQVLMWRLGYIESTEEAAGAEGTSGLGSLLQNYFTSLRFEYEVTGETIVGRPKPVDRLFSLEQMAAWRILYGRLGVEQALDWRAASAAIEHVKGKELNVAFRGIALNKAHPEITVADAVEAIDSVFDMTPDTHVYIGDLEPKLEEGMRKFRAPYGVGAVAADPDPITGLFEEEIPPDRKTNGTFIGFNRSLFGPILNEFKNNGYDMAHIRDKYKDHEDIKIIVANCEYIASLRDPKVAEYINAKYLGLIARDIWVFSGRGALMGHKDGKLYSWLEKAINYFRQWNEADGAADYIIKNRFRILPALVADHMENLLTLLSKRIQNEFDGSSYNEMVSRVAEKTLEARGRGTDPHLEGDEKRWAKYVDQYLKFGPIDRDMQMMSADDFNNNVKRVRQITAGTGNLSPEDQKFISDLINLQRSPVNKWHRYNPRTRKPYQRTDPEVKAILTRYMELKGRYGTLEKDLVALEDKPPMSYPEAVRFRIKAAPLKEHNWADDRLRIYSDNENDYEGNPDRHWNPAATYNNEIQKARLGIIEKIRGLRAPIQDYGADVKEGLKAVAEAFRSNAFVTHIPKIGQSHLKRYLAEWAIKFKQPPTDADREFAAQEGEEYPEPNLLGFVPTIQHIEDYVLHGASEMHGDETQNPLDAVELKVWVNAVMSGILASSDLKKLIAEAVNPNLIGAKANRAASGVGQVLASAGGGLLGAMKKSIKF